MCLGSFFNKMRRSLHSQIPTAQSATVLVVSCPVCLSEIGQDKMYSLKCGHILCGECCEIMQTSDIFLRIRCPICRTFSSPTKIQNIKCIKCFQNKIELVHLKCGHVYCFTCFCKLSTYTPLSLAECIICKRYLKPLPLYV